MNSKEMGIIIQQLWKLQSIWMFQQAVGSSHVCLCWTRQAEADAERIWVFVGFGKQENQHCGALAPELKPTCLWQWHTYSSHILLTINKTACAVLSVHLLNSVIGKKLHFGFHCTALALASVSANRELSLLACEDLLLQTCVLTRAPHQEQH